MRFRFSLRTLFLLMAIVNVPLSWVACQLNWIRRRHEFLKRDGDSYSHPGIGALTPEAWALFGFLASCRKLA